MTHILHQRGRDGAPAAPVARGCLKRFDPRYWTVDFPRPAMAALTAPAAGTLRADCVFYHREELAGLIWEADDRWDHPLTAYETRRDFSACTLSFRWRSHGLKPLDARHGPTLTIEGRDAAGAPRAWYVRLWNYAAPGGTPEDAYITLDFAALSGGFLWPGEADPVWAGDIDRMFISLVPPDYDGTQGLLAAPHEGWAELSEMRCDGAGSVLAIGDALVPEHGVEVATGYDDCYHLVPQRVVGNAHALGYRGNLNHYVGMSHYFRLEPNSGGHYASLAGGVLNGPCARWHSAFAAAAHALGFGIIWSLSYELFAAHCWGDWMQRAADGSPALTGWDPPSALLSPAHGGAMAYLQAVARAFIAIAKQAGLAPQFQAGEPWWWVRDDGRPCLYDTATTAALGSASVPLSSLKAPLAPAQTAMLDQCGALLAASTAALASAAKDEAGVAGCVTHILVYLPTVLDAAMPEARRANVPAGWAAPAFDILQLEDYDWAAAGDARRSEQAIALMETRLGYPAAAQHYLAGFVLRPADAAQQWPPIADAARRARARGVAATFIWALPQICRDGFTLYPPLFEETDMKRFDDIPFPISIGREATVMTVFSTGVVETASGHEQRMIDWANARMSYDAGPGLRSEADVATLLAFFRARHGMGRPFRFRDPFDGSSAADNGTVTPFDQPLGTGDAITVRFGLAKYYGEADAPLAGRQRRPITRPVPGTIRVAIDGVEQLSGWTHLGMGVIEFDTAPAKGAAISCGFEFDVAVRFAADRLEVSRATFLAGEIPSVPLIEVRDI